MYLEIAKESRAEGEAKDIVEAELDFGFSENDILIRWQRKVDISSQIAQEYFNRFGKQTV